MAGSVVLINDAGTVSRMTPYGPAVLSYIFAGILFQTIELNFYVNRTAYFLL
jgi:hypothetical protein